MFERDAVGSADFSAVQQAFLDVNDISSLQQVMGDLNIERTRYRLKVESEDGIYQYYLLDDLGELVPDNQRGPLQKPLMFVNKSALETLARESDLIEEGETWQDLSELERNSLISDNQLDKILTALNLVVSDVMSHRKNEGINTKKDLLKNIGTIESHIKKVEKCSEAHKKTIKQDLEIKSQNLKIENDYGRFEQELLYYLEKMDINEELVRLKSHINFFIETLDNTQAEKGKKLGFISQEIGREINTVGSKCNNSKIQNHVVEMKSSLEKIREQSLNLL